MGNSHKQQLGSIHHYLCK